MIKKIYAETEQAEVILKELKRIEMPSVIEMKLTIESDEENQRPVTKKGSNDDFETPAQLRENATMAETATAVREQSPFRLQAV